MGRYSAKSLSELFTAHLDLQVLFQDIVEDFDNKVLQGKRTEEEQRRNVESGKSKTMNSKHVYPLDEPSLALDVAPYPLEWPQLRELLTEVEDLIAVGAPQPELEEAVHNYAKTLARFYYFGGYVLGRADERGLKIRWGGDWDGDREVRDQDFDDTVHFELVRD
jgi:peptidoglycan LD-endopeptidase CwlK